MSPHLCFPLWTDTAAQKDLVSGLPWENPPSCRYVFDINILCYSQVLYCTDDTTSLTFFFFFKNWLLNIYSSHIMNTEWLYKCQEGAGELSWQRHKIWFVTKKTEMFSPSDSQRNCEHFSGKKDFVTLPVFFQPGGFSTSAHVVCNSTNENWMIDLSVNWLFNHSINQSQFNYHAVWWIRKHWDQLMKIEFMERIKQESI